ncbi:hypothetical protein [Kitasatospora sp. NPDC059327]|uniref:hypothetical protein n=1 Tax=Kitasatospora sp. NPDC059327 TaxID=3346803 RepID=UPI0036C66700
MFFSATRRAPCRRWDTGTHRRPANGRSAIAEPFPGVGQGSVGVLALGGQADVGAQRGAGAGQAVAGELLAEVQDWLGAYGYRFNGAADIDGVTSLGYPANGYNRPDSDFHDAAKAMYCHGNAVDAGNWNPFDDRLRLSCDMGHGASGGPIIVGFGGNNQIVGANSHRMVDSNNNWTDNYLYSSNHGGNATGLINWLNAH